MRHYRTEQTIVRIKITLSIPIKRRTYPIYAHGRDPPNFFILRERTQTYHLKTRIIDILL
jgi:hypothetical protein